MVDGHSDGRMPEHIGVKVKAQVQLLADGLQPLVKELSELLEGVILGGVLFLLLIIHDREDVAIFGLPLVLVNDMAHHRSHRDFNRTVCFLASDGDCTFPSNIPPLSLDYVAGREE